MKKNLFFTLSLCLLIAGLAGPMQATASREMENLDRGVVAICNTYPSTTVYVGWRMLGTEPNNVSYNIYRNGSKINGSPITTSCNYLDTGGNASSTYSVAAVIGGIEQERSAPVGTWTSAYLGSGQYMGCQEIPLEPRVGYEPNDISVGDLDGDGDYEFVLKRLSTDISHSSTMFHYLEAYQMDGTLMWTINLGPNNLFAPFEINPIVYDFDGDGRAEVALRTCEGTIDGTGAQIGDVDNDGITDYRSTAVLNSSYYMIDGPEFISMFDGQTGAEIGRVDYVERDPISQWGLPGMSDSQYGHRADKCMLTPAYLNGTTPSLVVSRGIYHKIILEAWNFRNGTFTQEWTFNSDSWPGYDSQGNHNLTVGDVDGDGFDEIVYGQMTVDHDGTGLYTTAYGHGDAIHMGEMIPGQGLQIFGVHESYPYGADLRDAATGEIIWSHTAGGDTGRGCAAHIDGNYPGYQMWDVSSAGTYDCTTTNLISANMPNWGNFLIWWDADLQREILDGIGSSSPSPIILKWDPDSDSAYRVINSLYNYPKSDPGYPYSAKCNNGTKSNPCISGDLIGDWREEAIYRSSDNTKLYIYTTCNMANNRIYTLMHDSMYRTAMAWQCNQYNQPPHPSFYIGAGMATPPTPDIYLAVPDSIAPAAPTGLSATLGASTIELDWTNSPEPDLASYTVYRSTTSGTNYSAIASNVASSAYSDSSVADTTTYYYVVTALDFSANESGFSAETNATTTVLDRTVEFWDFENSSYTGGAPSNNLAFTDTSRGDSNGQHGSYGVNGSLARGWDQTTGPQFDSDVVNSNGGSFAMDTVDDSGDMYVSEGPLHNWTSSNWTLELHAKLDTVNAWETLVGRDGTSWGNAESDFYLQRKDIDSNELRLNYRDVDGTQHILDGTQTIQTGQWYGFAVVADSTAGTLTMYIDTGAGYVQEAQITGLSEDLGITSSALNWTFGRGWYNENFVDSIDGHFDNIRFSSKALAPAELIPLSAPNDTDSDGLEDAWEIANFGNLAQIGTDDPDGDGDDNATEQANGTDPNVSSIPPDINVLINGGMLNLSWPSNNTGWRLLYRTNLLMGSWQEILGSDTNHVYEESSPLDSVFYKLVYP